MCEFFKVYYDASVGSVFLQQVHVLFGAEGGVFGAMASC